MSRQEEEAMMVPSRRSPVTLGEPPGPNSMRPTVRSSAMRNIPPLDSIPLARLPLPVLSRRPLDLSHPSPSSAPDAAHAPAPVFHGSPSPAPPSPSPPRAGAAQSPPPSRRTSDTCAARRRQPAASRRRGGHARQRQARRGYAGGASAARITAALRTNLLHSSRSSLVSSIRSRVSSNRKSRSSCVWPFAHRRHAALYSLVISRPLSMPTP